MSTAGHILCYAHMLLLHPLLPRLLLLAAAGDGWMTAPGLTLRNSCRDLLSKLGVELCMVHDMQQQQQQSDRCERLHVA
jgi:hypothetical protein